jgi:RNA polymerase sigma-70 factor (ECF subfamily)
MARGEPVPRGWVFQQISRLVHSSVRRQVVRAGDAQDIVQEVLLKVFLEASRFDPARGTLVSWVRGMAKSEVRTIRKRYVRRRETGSPDSFDEVPCAATSSPESLVISCELARLAEGLLAHLTPRDAQVLRSDAHEERIGPADVAARKQLQRARARLRGAWKKHVDDGA